MSADGEAPEAGTGGDAEKKPSAKKAKKKPPADKAGDGGADAPKDPPAKKAAPGDEPAAKQPPGKRPKPKKPADDSNAEGAADEGKDAADDKPQKPAGKRPKPKPPTADADGDTSAPAPGDDSPPKKPSKKKPSDKKVDEQQDGEAPEGSAPAGGKKKKKPSEKKPAEAEADPQKAEDDGEDGDAAPADGKKKKKKKPSAKKEEAPSEDGDPAAGDAPKRSPKKKASIAKTAKVEDGPPKALSAKGSDGVKGKNDAKAKAEQRNRKRAATIKDINVHGTFQGKDFNYAAPPPIDRNIPRMDYKQLVEAILEERERRLFWEKEAAKKKRELSIASTRLDRVRQYTSGISAKLRELDIETELLEVEKKVVNNEFKSQLEKQQDDFCNKILELERHMDNNELAWHVTSCDLRDGDIAAMNEHLQKEDEVHLELDELKQAVSANMEHLKAIKQAYVRRSKVMQLQKQRIAVLRAQWQEQRALGLGGASIASTSVLSDVSPSPGRSMRRGFLGASARAYQPALSRRSSLESSTDSDDTVDQQKRELQIIKELRDQILSEKKRLASEPPVPPSLASPLSPGSTADPGSFSAVPPLPFGSFSAASLPPFGSFSAAPPPPPAYVDPARLPSAGSPTKSFARRLSDPMSFLWKR
ncbi:hypothetical protein DIPPA_33162 [Diplonema papillatum]|nr:hypothetical protein DIPPA_33162 [Diplonema papillatum]KAJ9473087.1 hypothetical protein DIPPA_33162 [Diplonema papillatum]KAJ9473088.1 hypothetical protein DIPPA_33162 [Diplonema papillatum]